ncbi:hypothetical protein EN802_15645 [bacterium M00.F.Ca.ET.159.01.1.1]|nr:hypothetical protein EN873_20355 [bacterium M00.F.Ca.ET.230.01.1.1]TGT72399.1 hypothetical protein EN802_15645 [bacterium M00.F.Ca.ET.159.01.1.1]TGT85568.1 hypothetical protein EN800_10050 [bacterium M00.F.Ca.ET.157.01.1.1]
MAQRKTTFGGVDLLRFLAAVMVMFYHHSFWVRAFPDGIPARATGGIPPYPEMGFAGSGWQVSLIAAEAEPRIRLLLGHTLFNYRSRAA